MEEPNRKGKRIVSGGIGCSICSTQPSYVCDHGPCAACSYQHPERLAADQDHETRRRAVNGLKWVFLGALIGVGAVLVISGGFLVWLGWKVNALLLGLEEYLP